MRSFAEPSGNGEKLKVRARTALFIALAAMLQAGETLIPTPAPWFRLGLGNALVLAALTLWGVRAGVWVGLGKVLLGGLITGRLLAPGFLLSAGGTSASLLAMVLVLRLPLGFVGVSVVGAAAHSAAQLAIAHLVILGTGAVWALAPVAGVAALVSGVLTGVAAAWLYRVVEEESGEDLAAMPSTKRS